MVKKGINTFPRYIYLNSYAFLLLFIGIGIGVLPVFRISMWLIIPQAIFVIIFLRGCFRILSTWNQKKREYSILFARNEHELTPSSFTDYMQAPCGRLLTKLVLKDLDKTSSYTDLKKLGKPFIEFLKDGCRGQQTVVTVYKRPN